jgi:hypothetical protein
MSRRKNQIARVDRKVLPKDYIYVTDLWGNKQVRMVWCEYHKKYEDCRHFFFESKPRSKHEYDLRNMCIVGWEITNGNTRFNPDSDALRATLFSFFEKD